MDDLRELDRAILDFERSWWKSPGPKALAVRDRLHISSTQYYRRLGELLDLPSALAYDPLTVKRLLRSRAGRRRARYESRWADPRSSR